VLVLGAHRINGEPGTGVDIKKVIEKVDPAALIALSLDYPLIDLDHSLPTSGLLNAAALTLAAQQADEEKNDEEAWVRIVKVADEILDEAGIHPVFGPEPERKRNVRRIMTLEREPGVEVTADERHTYPLVELDEAIATAHAVLERLSGDEPPDMDSIDLGVAYSDAKAELRRALRAKQDAELDLWIDKPAEVKATATEELWIGAPTEGPADVIGAVRALPEIGDRINAPDFPGWDGSLVTANDVNGAFPIRVEKKGNGSSGLFALDEVIVIPRVDPTLPEDDPDSEGPFPAGFFWFYVNMDTPGRQERLTRRLRATLEANRPVRLTPANKPDLKASCWYVEVDAELAS